MDHLETPVGEIARCGGSLRLRVVETEGSYSQARKKSIKIHFLGPETARWGGGLPREGVVAEKFVPSLDSLSSLVSKGGI